MRQMGKRIYTVFHKGKKIEMNEEQFESYQKDAASSAVKNGKKLKKFGYEGADPKGVRVNQPTPTYGQANNQRDIDGHRQMLQEIIALSGALERIQGQVQTQGILTPEQVSALIIPLKQQIAGLADRMVVQNDYKLQPNRWAAPAQPTEQAKPFAGEETPEEEAAEEEHEEAAEAAEGEQEKKPTTFGQAQEEQKPEQGMNNPSQRQLAEDEKKPAEQKPTERQATQEAGAKQPQGAQAPKEEPKQTIAVEDEYLKQARELDPKGYYDPVQLAETLRRLAEDQNRKRPQPQAGPKRREGTLERDLENPSTTYSR